MTSPPEPDPIPPGPEWQLRADPAGGRAAVLRLRPDTVRTMGRAANADLVVDAPFLSRVHCRLTARADVLLVEDLRSTNGTFVNGRRVERAALGDGDRLTVGRLEFAVSRHSVATAR